MMAVYAGSTIRQAYIAMGTMFRAAVMNDIIGKHPMDGVRYTKPVREQDIGIPPQSAHLAGWPAQDPDQLSDDPADQPGVQHPSGTLQRAGNPENVRGIIPGADLHRPPDGSKRLPRYA